ncbi:MAG: BNR-4 repeat-containing protein [Pirellulales bacterium]|nr:BNR-4 repeat-containing protein [Pirellulales bacterium]
MKIDLLRFRCLAAAIFAYATIAVLNSGVRAQVTYVDADWTAGNTVVAATGLDPATVDNVAVAGNVWSVRHPFGNEGSLLQGRGDAVESSTPELKTALAGLAPGNYDLYVFYWSDSGDWSIRAGLESGALADYNTSQPRASTLSYVSDPLFIDGARSLYAARVGNNVTVSGGSASIFINDLGSTISSDRTWYDGVGYRLHDPNEPPPDFVAGDLITFTNTADAPNGAWSWFEDERVIVDADTPGGPRIVVSSISYASSGAEAGDVDVLWYDVNSAQQGRFELHDRLQNDDHNSAALWIRPDGRYLAAYSSHTTGGTPIPVTTAQAQQVRYRISEPHDPSDWGEEFTHNADGFRITTYNNLHYLPGDDGGAGRLYNFHRNVGFDPHILVSSDHGDTWSEWGNLVTFGDDTDRPYVKYASDGDRIHFITTEAHSNAFNTSIYAGYVKDGQLFGSNGSLLDADLASGTPVDVTALTSVFNVNTAPYQGAYSSAWTVDAEMDDAGNPYVVFQARIDPGAVGGDPVTHQYFYARLADGAWTVKELALGGGGYALDGGYSGLVALHPNDPNRLFLSSEIDPRDGLPTPHFEIYEGVTDNGDAWSWTAVTENSTMDNARPIVPNWDDSHTALLWMRGNYDNYEQWSTEVVGLVLGEAPTADFDDDGDVDGADFLIWQRGVGLTGQTDFAGGDANHDGDSDGDDLEVWREQFGSGPGAEAAAVSTPEPTSWIMAAVALGAVACRRTQIKLEMVKKTAKTSDGRK